MKKILALLLAFSLLALTLPLSATAYGADGKMAVNFINIGNINEGSSVVMTAGSTGTVGDYGNYAWWRVYVFDWDSTEKVYKCVEINTNANNSDKTGMSIPLTGFALGMCMGNDYPSIGDNSRPNYVSAMIKDTHAAADTLKIGSKVYLYNIDLLNGYVQNNGKPWYTPEYVTESFIKIGSPESGMTAYDPTKATSGKPMYKVSPTNIDKVVYEAGETLIFTPNFGKYILPIDATSYTYDWWSVIVCDWSDSEKCYKVISKDSQKANSSPKYAPIPDVGFAVAACNATLDSVEVGDKVYLQGIDPEKGTMKSGAALCFNRPSDEKTAYKPDTSKRLGKLNITNMTTERTPCSESGFTVEWDKLSGADKYVIALHASDIYPDGAVLETAEITGTSYKLTTKLKAGATYTLSIYAVANGKKSSEFERRTLSCVSASAVDSKLKDKTVIAFGDSLTARPGWVTMLYGHIGTVVRNSGVGGDSTENGLRRINADVLRYSPDVVLIGFGMNDQAVVTSRGSSNIPIDTYIANLTSMITQVQAIGADVVLICPNPVCTENGYYKGGEYGLDYGTKASMAEFCSAIRSLAFAYKCQLIDMNAEFQSAYSTGLWAAGDGIHQSAAGHMLYAECAGKALGAIYSGSDAASITVKCVSSGKTVATHTYTGAKGAHVFMTAPQITGLSCSAEGKMLTYGTDKEITFEYTANNDVLTLKTGSVLTLDGSYIKPSKDGLTESAFRASITSVGYALTQRFAKYVGTGSTLTLANGKNYTVVLAGDANGDGRISAADYLLLKRCAAGSAKLEGVYLKAGDVDGNGISESDCTAIKNHATGKKALS